MGSFTCAGGLHGRDDGRGGLLYFRQHQIVGTAGGADAHAHKKSREAADETRALQRARDADRESRGTILIHGL